MKIQPGHRKGRKGERKGAGVDGKFKKSRKKESVLLFLHTLLFFSFIPSVEGRAGVQRAGPGAEGSSALLWGPRQGRGKGDRT